MYQKSARQKIAIQKSKDQKNNKDEYQSIAKKVREKRSLLESLAELKKLKSEKIQSFGITEKSEPRTQESPQPIQLNLFPMAVNRLYFPSLEHVSE